uniref:Uncharacterized protein n=1 Tax=Anguilla anguilla TaxID=7936 RepID=A0A0E9P7Q0_ANGAN
MFTLPCLVSVKKTPFALVCYEKNSLANVSPTKQCTIVQWKIHCWHCSST